MDAAASARQSPETPGRTQRRVGQHCWPHTIEHWEEFYVFRAPPRNKCLLWLFTKTLCCPSQKFTKSWGTFHMLPDTKIPGASTEELLSVQVKACCVRLQKTHWATGLTICRSDAENVTGPPTHLIISDTHSQQDPIRQDIQRSHIFFYYSYTTTPNNMCKTVSQLRYS